MRRTSVKVKTSELLKAVQDRRAEMIASHGDAVVAYDNALLALKDAAMIALSKALGDADKKGIIPGTETSWRRSDGQETLYLKVPVKVSKPEKPALNTSEIDRLIKTLEMAADDAITVSADDAARYLG